MSGMAESAAGAAEAALAAAIPPCRPGGERTRRLAAGERALYQWILRHAWWEPRTAVVLGGTTCEDGPSFHRCCDVANFFETRESAERYLREHPSASGLAISIPDAIEAGRAAFGGLLEGH